MCQEHLTSQQLTRDSRTRNLWHRTRSPAHPAGIHRLRTCYGEHICHKVCTSRWSSTYFPGAFLLTGQYPELGARPHPGRRQSQYSWAQMDPSAHSLAFRGGAEVPDLYTGRGEHSSQLPAPATP